MSPVDRWKLIFGFCLLGALLVLAVVVGLAKVSAETSFGLDRIITGLLMLASGFATWAFGRDRPPKE